MLVGHKKQWEFLKRKFETDQLSHAYLFTGEEGIGKKLFAKEFADFIGCKFPDLLIIEKKEDKSEIEILQIREVQIFLSYKSYNGGYKIVIINDVEKMNVDAQDCLLKDLEEPKGKTLFFLITSKPDIILPTIFSRCQQIKFFRSKDLPQNTEKLAREQDILNNLLPVLSSNFAEKFKYVKNIDFEKTRAEEIILVLEKYLRRDLEKNKKTLELTEEINKKLMLTNASPKLALEILLMNV